MKLSKGIALFQVLIMTAVMAVIALSFSYTAKEQVAIAQAFSERFHAELKLRTLKSRLLFTLFRTDPVKLSDKVFEKTKWNFRGQKFELMPGGEVSIEAVVGSFSLVTTPPEQLRSLFVRAGLEESDANRLLASLQDWMDKDNDARFNGAESAYYRQYGLQRSRNGPLQHLSELRVLPGMSETLFDRLSPYLTTYATQSFNPALAPPLLNEIVFGGDLAKQIKQLQDSGGLTEEKWQDLVGFKEFPGIDLHPMSLYKVTLSASYGQVTAREKFDLKLQSQQSREPIILLRSY